jgi:predicted transglutaminase-like cysteine proteinase
MAHIRFCMTYEGQCDAAPDRRESSHSRQDHWAEAMKVNFAVNRAIRSEPDAGFDTWDIHVPKGDCEDYALQKRAELIARGWPTDHLRLAIVRTKWGEPHAVLLVRIGTVDYALDNLTPSVKPWDETGHDYLILQDRHDPKLWHDVSPRGGVGATS